MAETVERLVATLEADIRGFSKGMQQAQREFDARSAQIERRQNALMNRLNSGFARTATGGIQSLIGRYIRLGLVIQAARLVMRESIETNAQAAQAWGRLEDSFSRLSSSLGPQVEAVLNGVAFALEKAAQGAEMLNRQLAAGQAAVGQRFGQYFPGVPRTGGVPFANFEPEFAGFNKQTGNWTPTIHGFPVSGVTDVTPAKPTAGKADEPVSLTQALDFTEAMRDLEGQIMDTLRAEQAWRDEQVLIGRELQDNSVFWANEAAEALAELKKEAEELEAERVADRISEIGDAFEYLGHAAFQGGEAFERAVIGMMQSLAISGLRSLFESALGSLAGGGGFLGNLIAGTRHSGGPVEAGRAYIVGKPGAEELFVPRTSGMIIPNAAAASGGGSMVLNMPIDARGAQAGVAEQIARIAPAIVAAAVRESGRQFKSNLIRTQRNQM